MSRRFRGDPIRRWAYSRDENVKPWPMWGRIVFLLLIALFVAKAAGLI